MNGSPAASTLSVALDAVIVAVSEDDPRVLLRLPSALPAGPFEPDSDLSLERQLRRWVTDQTHLELGHVEQLYTLGGRRRAALSIAYLAFVRESAPSAEAAWRSWYDFFPWEEWRDGRPAAVEGILAAIEAWVGAASGEERERRARRARRCTGLVRGVWNADLVLERYELLWEIGLVAESPAAGARTYGEALALDHRRIVATAMQRIRGALRYRPVVFDLLPPEFTLLRLQRTVEALAGVRLHKQNFRRLIAGAQLVEPTRETERDGPGRPAALYRFRPDVVAERTMLSLSITPARP